MKIQMSERPLARVAVSGIGLVLVLSSVVRSQVAMMNVTGVAGDDDYGVDVTPIGDVNGDGRADFAVGVPRSIGPFGSAGGGPGSVRVLSGADGAVLFVGAGSHPNDLLGTAVAGGGDVNGDGFPDLIAGGFTLQATVASSGGVRVFSVAQGSVLFTAYGDSANDWLGFSVADAGDLNGDGFAEVAVGIPYDDNTGTDTGAVRVYTGGSGTVLYTLNGSSSQGGFGRTLDGIGDATGDGRSDLAVGAPYVTAGLPQSGLLRIYSGATGALHLSLPGTTNFESLGGSVARVGDFNGDDRGDVLVGTSTNTARILSGANGSTLQTFAAGTSGDWFGSACALAGDFNGDGTQDVVVGAPRSNLNGTESGAAYVFSGQGGAILQTLRGMSAFAHFGTSVAGIGDVDFDARADLVVGAPDGLIAGFSTGGVASLFVGLPATCANTPSSVDLNVDGVPDACQFCQSNLAAGGPGNMHLQICGAPLTFTGSVTTLGLSKGTPGGPLFLLASTSSNPTPALGGIVWPLPVITILSGNFNAEGKWRLQIPGGPSGPVNVYLQGIAPWPGGSSAYEISGPTLLKLGY